MRIRGARRRRSLDRGFVLSDHVDWPALLQAIGDTGAERVLVTHGYREPVVRWLREHGLDALAIASAWEGEEEGADELETTLEPRTDEASAERAGEGEARLVADAALPDDAGGTELEP
jgi:putative mRNA 3-end processing factor